MVLAGQARHGDAFRMNILGSRGVIFMHPDAVREVLLDRQQNLSSERGWANTAGRMFQGGLMLRDFEDHRLHRRVMQQAFRRSALAEYMAQINQLAREHLAAAAARDRTALDVHAVAKGMTLDISTRVFLGLELGPQAGLVRSCFADMMRATISPVRRALPGTAMSRGIRARERLAALLSRLVAQRRQGPPQPDLLSQLAHAEGPSGNIMSVDEVVRHMLFLLLAAHDTTASTLTVMIWHLAADQGWQERVADELRGLDGQDVSLENHSRLIQTEWVMKEALRLNPPTPFIPREAVRPCTIWGVPLEAGTLVSLPILGIHRHPDWWSEPDRFDPLRFSRERAEDKAHSHLYLPFGGGAHLCIGAHLAELIVKAALAVVLADHRLDTPSEAALDMVAIPTAKPRRKVHVQLHDAHD